MSDANEGLRAALTSKRDAGGKTGDDGAVVVEERWWGEVLWNSSERGAQGGEVWAKALFELRCTWSC